jgi:hypothetical protein
MPRTSKHWRLGIFVPRQTSAESILDMLRYENATVVSGPNPEDLWEIEMPNAPSQARWHSFGIRTGAAWVVNR